jgi:hypothetical protein
MNDLEKFSDARSRLMLALAVDGWTVTLKSKRAPWHELKIPHATKGDDRLWFRAQSVYVSHGKPFNAMSAHSICSDYRNVKASKLISWAEHRSSWEMS